MPSKPSHHGGTVANSHPVISLHLQGYKPDSSEYEKEKIPSNEVDNQVSNKMFITPQSLNLLQL